MKKKRYCVICGKKMKPGEWGNNPEPIKPYSLGTCCDECNMKKVVPARLAAIPKEVLGEEVKFEQSV
jgi:hypothetical protein